MLDINKKQELIKFYQNLPNKPYCGNFKQETRILPKKIAADYKYIQYQHPQIAKYICIDLDGISAEILDTSLIPNILVINKENPKGHAYFRLDGFVSNTEKAKLQPQRALRVVNHSIINFLTEETETRPDRKFNGQKAKNPLCEAENFRIYTLNKEPWHFEDFFEAIPEKHIYIPRETEEEKQQAKNLTVEITGRNCYLFDFLRFYAYKTKAKYYKNNNWIGFFEDVETVCITENLRMQSPLGYGEIKHIINSVVKFTWERYEGDGKNRGVMELKAKGHNLTLQDKQVLGAKYSHKIRTDDTEQRIVEAIESLQKEDKKITQKAIAERSGLNKNTLTKYRDLVKKLK